VIRHDFAQYSPEWWSIRRGVPTCSEFGRIITPATGKLSGQATGYAAELLGQMVDPYYGAADDYVSAAMKNGTIMEPEARAWYEFDAGAPVQQVGFCLTDDGRFGGSPDAMVGDDGCLELKSPTAKTQVLYLYAGKLPDEYKPQVHGHLVVTGRKWCDFVSYDSRMPDYARLFIKRLPRDDALIAEIEAEVSAFLDEVDAMVKKIESLKT
jgi:hypothetical protein